MSMTTRLISAALGGACVGAGIGYIVAEKRLAARFEERLEQETADMKKFYTVSSKQKYSSPQDAVADLVVPAAVDEKVAYHKVVATQEYISDENAEETTEEVIVHHNVFTSHRTPDKPYVISQEEFMLNEPEYPQSTLTYYSDDVLTDERDEVIDRIAESVGEECFSQFGVGSSDPNVVHVRNERLQIDFEIVRSDGKYSKDVLGLDEEDSMSVKQRMRNGR